MESSKPLPSFLRGVFCENTILLSKTIAKDLVIVESMNATHPHICTRATALLAILFAGNKLFAVTDPVDFNRDVRPILSEKCFHCHGFDEKRRQGELRLDIQEGATADLGGHAAIVPRDLANSELIKRIETGDPELLMPPESSHRKLSDAEKTILRKWIEQGAVYDKHWSFQPPAKSKLTIDLSANTSPDDSARWKRNAIDVLVNKRLVDRGLVPSHRATPEKWFRRVSLDITGLAPTAEQIDLLLKDIQSLGEPAYAKAVDSLLASPRYGERMAQDWLDAARYADTHGFNNDTERIMWRWRDWVIDAYNSNLPYDQFLTKQIAGDLLPNATVDDHVATGYCRNHVINSEGGIIDEEYRVEYVVDRVRTLGTSVLGVTLECSRCHDHKYDPFTQKDFYQLYAFFNQVDEVGEDGRDRNAFPLMKSPTNAQKQELERIEQSILDLSKRMQVRAESLASNVEAIKKSVLSPVEPSPSAAVPAAAKLHSNGSVLIEDTRFGTSYALKDAASNLELEIPAEANSLSKPWSFTVWVKWDGKPMPLLSSMSLDVDPSAQGFGRGLGIELAANGLVEIKMGVRQPAYALRVESIEAVRPNVWTHVLVTFDGSARADGIELAINNEATPLKILADGYDTRDALTHPTRPRLCSEHGKTPRWNSSPIASPKWFAARVDSRALNSEIATLRIADLASAKELAPEQSKELVALHLRLSNSAFFDKAFLEEWTQREALKADRKDVERGIATTMVMSESGPMRETFVLFRGQYNSPRIKVTAGVPDVFTLKMPDSAPRNRLGLAQWLTHPENPLTARVAVNRVWQQCFGVGLVKSSEDFGVQGEYPTNPELLDWLARDFIDTGWDVKKLIKGIVLSETYRQDSKAARELREVDPENRLLARGPRVRLAAEAIRDHVLNVGGLLKHRVGGPSVFPLQPDDLYKGIVVDAPYAGTKWGTSQGDDLYRRSLYTFWKRTVPYPVLTLFDAPDREFCVARRMNTNTPLQALTLMNEPSMQEAARGLATRMSELDPKHDPVSRAKAYDWAFRNATGRPLTDKERGYFEDAFVRLLKSFEAAPEDAKALLKAEAALPDSAYQATWVAVASMILNLDETITKD